jgi:hypothetical protein
MLTDYVLIKSRHVSVLQDRNEEGVPHENKTLQITLQDPRQSRRASQHGTKQYNQSQRINKSYITLLYHNISFNFMRDLCPRFLILILYMCDM